MGGKLALEQFSSGFLLLLLLFNHHSTVVLY
jgi:hypothetical protein